MEITERTLTVLQALSQLTEPSRPSKIGEIIGEKPLDIRRHLGELLKAGLAEKTDDTQNLWAMTEKGAEYLGNLGEQPVSQPHVIGTPSQPPVTAPTEVLTVPSQEAEKVKIEEKGEIPPKPKRFSIIAGQITGDPEGDYSFKEALLTG